VADLYLAELHALAPGAKRVVDRMPGNFLYLGLIGLMLPPRASSIASAIRATSGFRSLPSVSTARMDTRMISLTLAGTLVSMTG
jgi:hypothetical protein